MQAKLFQSAKDAQKKRLKSKGLEKVQLTVGLVQGSWPNDELIQHKAHCKT